MKNFFSLFTDSAKSLKDLRTLTTTGMLLAIAIVIRSLLGIQVTPDLRIVFTCVPMAIIGMLYGPVVCGCSTLALDIIGFIMDNKSARGYSIELAMVVVLSGILYGVILYKKEIKHNVKGIIRMALARGSVIVFCNIILNSYFLYSLYVNKDFSIFTMFEGNMMNSFLTWMTPRIGKNLIQYPADIILMTLLLPGEV